MEGIGEVVGCSGLCEGGREVVGYGRWDGEVPRGRADKWLLLAYLYMRARHVAPLSPLWLAGGAWGGPLRTEGAPESLQKIFH